MDGYDEEAAGAAKAAGAAPAAPGEAWTKGVPPSTYVELKTLRWPDRPGGGRNLYQFKAAKW